MYDTHMLPRLLPRRLRLTLLVGALCFQAHSCPCAVSRPNAVLTQSGDNRDIFKSEAQGDGRDFLGQIKNDQKFLILRHGTHKADLAVYLGGKLIDTMPDVALDLPSEHFDPGETYKGYDFYLSPDHRDLLVVRGLVRSLAVAYLYTRSGPGRMRAVRPGGLRLDDAALHSYCKHRRVDEVRLGRAARIVRFVQWDTAKHRLIFTMYSASGSAGGRQHRGDISAFWYTAYDLKTGAFEIITHPQGLPEPQVG